MSDNLLLEIDEAMRWERIEKAWKTYGNYVIGAVLVVILATAIMSGWGAWRNHVNSRNTNDLLTLLDDKNFPANINEDMKLSGPLRGIAFINAAASYAKKNKNEDALKFYKLAAQEKSAPGDIRDLGLMMQARILAAEGKALAADLETLLQPVLRSKKSPWHNHALLDAASYAAKDNDYTKARGYLKDIIDDKFALQGLKIKADALDRLYADKEKGQ